jgi:predicted nuclease of predicted toxin-antitoxin system
LKLADLRFLVDQSVHRRVTPHLQALGISAEHVADLGLSRAPDDELLALAMAGSRAILTHDLDFGGLAIAATGAAGVVILRPAHPDVSRTIEQPEWLIRQPAEVEFPFIATCQLARDGYLVRIRALA